MVACIEMGAHVLVVPASLGRAATCYTHYTQHVIHEGTCHFLYCSTLAASANALTRNPHCQPCLLLSSYLVEAKVEACGVECMLEAGCATELIVYCFLIIASRGVYPQHKRANSVIVYCFLCEPSRLHIASVVCQVVELYICQARGL